MALSALVLYTNMDLHAELRSLSFPGGSNRLEVAVSFLHKQDIDCVRELAGETWHQLLVLC